MRVIAPLDGSDKVLSRLLTGAWREFSEVPDDLQAHLPSLTPLILSTGAAALVWHHLQLTKTPTLPWTAVLQAAYRRHMLEAALHETEIKDLFSRMRAGGIEPVLFKGWALARLYPDAGVRPYGDIDLWIPAEQLAEGYRALRSSADPAYCVDLHTSFYPQYERSLADVIEKSQLIDLDGVAVRIPCQEDHLRFICLHFLYHGGWKPLWLCDVALMVESRAEDFDWERCLTGTQKYAEWIACVIGLARELLGANLAGTPFESDAYDLPSWLAPAVLKQWSEGPGMSVAENLSFSMPRRILKPTALFQAFREHWRNPIQASVEMNAWFDESPRALLQFGSAVLRIPEFAKFFGREIRRT